MEEVSFKERPTLLDPPAFESAFFSPSFFVELDLILHLPQSTRIRTASAVCKSKESKRSMHLWMLLLPVSDNMNLFWVIKTSLNSSQELLVFSLPF